MAIMKSNGVRALVGLGGIGALLSVLASITATEYLHDKAEDISNVMTKRNMDAFNRMDNVRHLDNASRAKGWSERQEAITREIGLNGNHNYDWTPFLDKNYAFDLLEIANHNRITLVPAASPGQKTTLVADYTHGCLMVDFSRSDAELANEARRLLQAFAERSAAEYEYRGIYDYDAAKRTTGYTTPLGAVKSTKASDYCP